MTGPAEGGVRLWLGAPLAFRRQAAAIAELRQPLRRALILPWARRVILQKTHKKSPMVACIIRTVAHTIASERPTQPLLCGVLEIPAEQRNQLFKIQEVVIARRLRRGNLDAVAATPVSKDSLAPTGLPRCARNDTSPATLNGYQHKEKVPPCSTQAARWAAC